MKSTRFDDLKKLYLVKTLIEQNSLNKTAQIHKVTPSAISQSIKTLEINLGYPVVTRAQDGWKLTEKGLSVLQKAEEIFSVMDKSFEIEDSEDLVIGSLSIGAYESFAADAFRTLGQKLRLDFPAIKLNFLVARSGDLVKKILNGEICTALMVENDALNENIVAKTLYEDSLGLYSAKPISLADIQKNSSLICGHMAAGPEGYPIYFKKFIKQFRFAQQPMVCDSIEVLRQLAETGEVISVLPSRVAKKAVVPLYKIGQGEYEYQGSHKILIAASTTCDHRELNYLHNVLTESGFGDV